MSDEDKKKLSPLYEKFDAYVAPKSNPIFARFKFYSKDQGQSESFEDFVTELILLVKDCGFDKPDEMVRDRIVYGTNSKHVRQKLIIKGSELTLDIAVDIARTYEISQSQLQSFYLLFELSIIYTGCCNICINLNLIQNYEL